jgi:hypothetical protein
VSETHSDTSVTEIRVKYSGVMKPPGRSG